tara:strand:- start:260 stop:418 length:159 start_codon:yes stop_codon:yes gene_type:complete
MVDKKKLLADIQQYQMGLTGQKKEHFNFAYHVINNMNPELLDIIIYDWNKRS